MYRIIDDAKTAKVQLCWLTNFYTIWKLFLKEDEDDNAKIIMGGSCYRASEAQVVMKAPNRVMGHL